MKKNTTDSSPSTGKAVYQIYSHGWGARVRLDLSCAQARDAVKKLGWRPKHPGWKNSSPRGGERWDIKSCAWLIGRKPSRNSGLYTRNREWGTILYNLSVQEGKDAYYLNLGGIRRSDLDCVMGGVLGLSDDQWNVQGWRTYERYVVLTTVDAIRLSEALGGQKERRRGREAAKVYLLRDHFESVSLNSRKALKINTVMYRVAPERGVTHAWKLETRMKRPASVGTPVSENEAICALDSVLRELVKQHGLKPIDKPARWEPRDPGLPVETADRIPDLKGLVAKAYRGIKPDESDVHTPWPFVEIACTEPVRVSAPESVISVGNTSQNHPSQENRFISKDKTVESLIDESLQGLSTEIVSCPGGNLFEVVLPYYQSPGPLIRAIGEKPGVKLAMSFLTYRFPRDKTSSGVELAGYEMGELMCRYPVSQDDATHWVVVVDSECIHGVQDILHGRPPAAGVSEHLAEACKGWARLSEETGLNIILITYDARPVRGLGSWQPGHNFKDTRVRSLLGNAGRYYAHMRYRINGDEMAGPQSVVVLKDGINGLGAGRIVWEALSVPPVDLGFLCMDDVEELLSLRSTQSGPIATAKALEEEIFGGGDIDGA